MSRASAILTVSLLVCLPAMAGSVSNCTVAEDNDATSKLEHHAPTAAVLERVATDRLFRPQDAASQLDTATGEELDKVVGYLRLIAETQTGDRQAEAYSVLNHMRVRGRADVADQFIKGLNSGQTLVRDICARGLRAAPSSKREVAGLAILKRLPNEPDERVYHLLLDALRKVAVPEHKDRIEDLRRLLTQEPPVGPVTDQVAEWKHKSAVAVVNVLGPEDAVRLFRALDPTKTGERLGIEGAIMALAGYGTEQFAEMDPVRRDKLRDLFREYGVQVLTSADSLEAAERDQRVRSAVVSYLFAVILGPSREELRSADVEAIRAALTDALAIERAGSELVPQINFVLDQLP